MRRLAFGPERDFVRHLGVYVATTPLGDPPEEPHDVLLHNTPGRLVAMHPVRGEAGVAFIFRHPAVPGFDHHDLAQHRRILAEAYAGEHGWRVPELLARAQRADDLYFDAVSKVVLPSWSVGRVVLLGDAAASVSLFGDGSSMAIAGARTLAATLAEGEHIAAFRRYEAEHRRRTDARGRGAASRRGHAAIGDQGTSPWLFPGGQPGRPISSYQLAERLRQLGLHPGRSRPPDKLLAFLEAL